MLNRQKNLAHGSGRPEFLGGSGGMISWEILKSRLSEMHFPAL